MNTASRPSSPPLGPAAPAAADRLAAECEGLRPGGLARKARELGVEPAAIETAQDSEDQAAALTALIVQAAPRTAAEQVAAECEDLKNSALARKARDLGVGEPDIEDAQDAADARAALLALIVRAVPPSLAEECAGLKPGGLARKAREMGVDSADIEVAQDAADPAVALTKLVLDRPLQARLEGLHAAAEQAAAQDGTHEAGMQDETQDEQEGSPDEPVGGKTDPQPGDGADGPPEPKLLMGQPPRKMHQIQPLLGSPVPATALDSDTSPVPVAVYSPSTARLTQHDSDDLKFLQLVNDVQDINLQELDMTDAGVAVEWPQICVLGGQAEGKSTLLSAVVSAKMRSKMRFLPEGTGMVTRCPIEVQMTCPKDVFEHSASVSTQRAGASDDVDRLGGAIPGPGLDPAAEELDRWGAQIRERITALQDHIVPAGEITHQKIIVRLQGPRLPNLSLVDLPGLRAVDEERHAGLKEKLRRMVTEVVRSPNAIILCVGQAGVDPANWAGRGLAKEVDVLERRTIGVVTKVDTLFGVPDTELQRATQAQLKAVLDDVGSDTPYYAAYNPKPDDEAEFLRHGIDLQARVEGYFSAARVGNAAIAEDLQGKLVAHLQAQLPELYERFTDKLDTLNAELSTTAAPSWQVVEQVLLGYGRMVQGYVERGSDPDEVEAGFGLFQHWGHEADFKTELMNLVHSFNDKVAPQFVYDDEGAARSVLHRPTAELLQEVAQRKTVSLADARAMGTAWARDESKQKPDDIVAVELGIQLARQLKGLCADVLENIAAELLPLCREYYETVAKVTFKLDMLDGNAQRDYTKYQVAAFVQLHERLRQSADRLLEHNWEKVRAQADADKSTPTAEVVSSAFLPIKEVQDALLRVCRMWQADGAAAADASHASLPRGSMRVSFLPAVVAPPEGDCCKQKPTLRTWPSRYLQLKGNGAGSMGLYVYAGRGDPHPRETSIEDLRGCTVQKARQKFTFGGNWFKLTVYGEHLAEPYVHFAFQDEDKRDEFYEACKNLGEGRHWNKTELQEAAEAAEVASQAEVELAAEIARAAEALMQTRLDAEREVDAAAAPEPEGTHNDAFAPAFERPTTTQAEVDALTAGAGDRAHAASLLDIGSKAFRDFYAMLRADPAAVSEHQLLDECRAESFRLWSLQLVRAQTTKQIQGVANELNRRFFDTASATGPFSATAIYGKVDFSAMITEHLAGARPGRQHGGRGKPAPGPADLLRLSDGVRDRRRKEAQQRTLSELCRKFEQSGLF